MSMPRCTLDDCDARHLVVTQPFCKDHWFKISTETRAKIHGAMVDANDGVWQGAVADAIQEIKKGVVREKTSPRLRSSK